MSRARDRARGQRIAPAERRPSAARRHLLAIRGDSERLRALRSPRARLIDSGHPSEALGIDLDALARDNLTAILAGLGALALVELLLVVWLARRVSGVRRRVDALTRGHDGLDLAGVLDRHLDTVTELSRTVDALGARTRGVEEQGRLAFQRVGLVRYNPFEDTGGNQSFALALLDGNLDGFVISSLHARSGTRVYAKALSHGRASTGLSAEESEAIRIAMGSGGRPGS